MVYTLRFLFSLQNAVCFIILTCLVSVLFTFYIQGMLKLKKNNSGAKRLVSLSDYGEGRNGHCPLYSLSCVHNGVLPSGLHSQTHMHVQFNFFY